MTERLDYIDKAKGLLIILVVIGHIWQAGVVHNFIYSFHMPAFFVISGILMRHARSYEKPYSRFLIGRLYSFGVPFLFFEMLGILTDILRHGVTLNIKGYIFNTISLQYNDCNMWFLVSLFLIEAIFLLAKKILRKDWVVGAFCLILFFGYLFLPRGENRYIQTLMQVFHYFLFFTAGFYAKSWFERKNGVCIGLAVMIPVIVSGVLEETPVMDFCKNMALLLSGFAGTYAVLQFGKLEIAKKLSNLFSFAGKNSITIYGTHHIVYAATGVLLGITDYATTPLWAGMIMLAVVSAVDAPTIYVINRWLPFLAGKRRKKKPVLYN